MSDPALRNKAFEPYLRELGVLALVWSDFEFTVNDAIWELSNIERGAGACLTSQFIGPGPRLRCFIALLNFRNIPQALIGGFNSLSAEAEKLGRQRNRFLHDPLMAEDDSHEISRLEATADRKLKYGFVPISPEEIKDLSTKIENLTRDFDALYIRVTSQTPSWPRKQFEQSWGIDRVRSEQGSYSLKPERPRESSAE